MGYLFDDQDTREPDLWASIGVILILIAVVLLICFLSACAAPASGRATSSRPIRLMHFEIKTESGKVISDVKTWSYEDENDTDRAVDTPVRR